jgi:type VI secretion system secreted protein VgrG
MAGTVNLSVNSSPGPWQENQVSPSRYFDEVNASGTKDPSILSNVYDVIQTRAQNMATAASSRVITAEGSSTCMNLVPGFHFVLEKHPTADGSWLVLELTHKARQQGAFWNGEQANIQYENRFKAAPSSVNQKPWPPIARPVVGSVETAIVTGQTNQESNLDPFGRVQVRFWWDDPESSGHTSCWIRVAQFWAGQGYGAFFWPRVGHEVVVAFEHGDPDRPIVVGSVYNSNNTTPYSMPGNTYISGFRTKTQGGSAAENCHKFTLSDVPGSEIINIHAESMLITNQEKRLFTLRSTSTTNIN